MSALLVYVAVLALLAGAGPALPEPSAPATPADATTGRAPIVRRGVDTSPRMAPPDDVIVRNSGSTNVPGYTLVVRRTGDVDVTVNGETNPKTLPAPQTKWLFEKVREAAPLDALPAGGCMKSVSFGSSTTISSGGVTSPDISCGSDAVKKELARTVQVVLTLLDVHPQRGRLMKP